MNHSRSEPKSASSGRFSGNRRDLLRQLEEAFVRMQRLVISRHALSCDGEVSRPQYLLLHMIHRTGPRSISELAAVLDIRKPGASGLVARLEKAGLLTRERDAHDRRVIRVALTPAGVARIRELEGRVREEFEQALAALDDGEVVELVRLYNKLIDAAEHARGEDR